MNSPTPPALRILRARPGDPLLDHERDLRRDVLLRPVGIDLPDFERGFPEFERLAERFLAAEDHPGQPRIVGCASLLPGYPRAGVGKLMQMAVAPGLQGTGVGRLLVKAVERRAFHELALRELFCHARANVVGFYAALGWRVPDGPAGEPFQEVGIEHRRMIRLVR